MAEKSGFFNAAETDTGVYDRTYDAEDFAKYFATFIGNGVFVNPSNQLKVVPKTGLTVTVKAGKAFIDGYWYELDEDMDIALNANGTPGTITDVIACTLNKSTRTITTAKKESVSSTLPVNNGTTHELILAIISVGVGVSSLTASNITDTRPDNTYCGYVGALIEQPDFGNLFSQLESQFNDWFDKMKGQLSTDAAGNLQNQIGVLSNLKTKVKTSIVNAINSLYENTVDKMILKLSDISKLSYFERGNIPDALAVKELYDYVKNVRYKLSDESVLINTNETRELTITFEKVMTIIPVVIATPYTSSGGPVAISIKNITNRGFTTTIRNLGSSPAYFKVCYFAWDTNIAR